VPDSRELKPYSSPRLNELRPEQAKLILIGAVTLGYQGARDLMDVMFPDPNQYERVSIRIAEERPDDQGPSRTLRSSLTEILASIKGTFYRVVAD
jgi:hypothetical protein